MQEIAKLLIITGLFLIGIGALFLLLSYNFKLPVFKLPGDIIIDRPNFKFFFPITTCILISIIISFLLWLLLRR